jgi:hypothetical protein
MQRNSNKKVKKMYRDVAMNPAGDYHFEMGRGLAEKLGYEKTGSTVFRLPRLNHLQA